MKKLMVLLCALMLVSLSPAKAQESYTAYCGAAKLFTLSYDSAAYSLDTNSYLGTSGGGHTWLGMFYSSSYTIDCAADKYGDLSLSDDSGSAASQLTAYLSSALAGEQAALVETCRCGGIPFAIFSLGGGQSYYAAAAIGGYAVSFEIYNMRGGVDEGALRALKAFLNGISL